MKTTVLIIVIILLIICVSFAYLTLTGYIISKPVKEKITSEEQVKKIGGNVSKVLEDISKTLEEIEKELE